MRWRPVGLLLLTIIAIPASLAGQSPADRGPFIWRADLTGQTQYYWRGIRLNDRFALQPDLALGWMGRGISLTTGGRASGNGELEDVFEEYFDEWNLWGQA